MNKELSFDLDRMLFANIKIPIIIKENNDIEYLNDYANIFFEKCDEIPEKQQQTLNMDFSQFFTSTKIEKIAVPTVHIKPKEPEKITVPIEPVEPEKPIINLLLTVSPEEIKRHKRSLNYSFKNKSAKSANFTKKNLN